MYKYFINKIFIEQNVVPMVYKIEIALLHQERLVYDNFFLT